MRKVGVFVCHCGANIASMVDIDRVVEATSRLPEVAYVSDSMFTCSAPGQTQIRDAVEGHGLDGVVGAACSRRMHEPSVRRAVKDAGLNP